MAGPRMVAIGARQLEGALECPPNATGLVIFAHGSGSGRHSPRNVSVARHLQQRGFATLLLDLLTQQESADRRNVFDIPLLASRVQEAMHWARSVPELSGLPIGLFGASTGAGAALVAAAAEPALVAAVVSRGGRPDMAGEALPHVQAPTLLIVGGADTEVIALNRAAASRMRCEKKIEIVPGAGHLFEEPNTLERVMDLASAWFEAHLAGKATT